MLSCSDSRVSVPLLFSQLHLGQIFEIKNAGNLVDKSCLESIKYAISYINPAPELIVVLGHTRCGAVTACFKYYEHNDCGHLKEDFPFTVTQMQQPMACALAAHSGFSSDDSVDSITKMAAQKNVQMQVSLIREQLGEILDCYKINLAQAMYDVDSGEVKFIVENRLQTCPAYVEFEDVMQAARKRARNARGTTSDSIDWILSY